MCINLSWLMDDETHEFNHTPRCPNCKQFMDISDASSFGEVLIYECVTCDTSRVIMPEDDD